MASEMSEQMKPMTDFYSKWSKDSLEMMSKGMSMFNKMTGTWAEVAERDGSEKTEDPLKKWTEAFSGPYNELFEMYTQPFKMFGMGGQPSGKEAWEDAFAKWQKMFTAIPSGSAPAVGDEFMNFSKNWFEGYSKICQSWVESMQKMGEACKSATAEGEKPDSDMGALKEISDRFMKQWTAFVTEQAQAFFTLWRSRLPAEKKEPVKKTKKE